MEEYGETLARIDERVKTILDDVKEINHTLHGNGKDGLCDIAVRNRDRISELEKDLKNHKDGTKWIVGISITIIAVIVSIINVIFNCLL